MIHTFHEMCYSLYKYLLKLNILIIKSKGVVVWMRENSFC